MKIIILSILIILSTNLFAQTNDSSKNYFLNIELSLIHSILGGFGGTIGLDIGNDLFKENQFNFSIGL